jgi:hypothetical protein
MGGKWVNEIFGAWEGLEICKSLIQECSETYESIGGYKTDLKARVFEGLDLIQLAHDKFPSRGL